MLLKKIIFIFCIFASNLAYTKEHIIGFGSCIDQNYSQPIWASIKDKNVDTFMFLGDNVYGDHPSGKLDKLKKSYLSQSHKLPKWLKNKKVVSIWDDHDYGINDGGKSWLYKNISKEIFLNFFGANKDDIRRKRQGIYKSYNINFNKKKIKIIGLDTRSFKDDFTLNKNKNINIKYINDKNKNKTILGESQWNWLVQELNDNYDLLIILSSFQVLSTSHGWEKWHNIISERKKLLNLLDNKKNITLILSGDRHRGGIYKLKRIYEITASSFNQRTFSSLEEDNIRIGGLVNQNNFGVLEIENDNIKAKLVSSNIKEENIYKTVKLKF